MTEPTTADRREPADWPFAAAAFLGSSLVFVVQPIIAKQLLPTLGGAPAVWTTCVLFFQFVLLIGYAWAHLGPQWLGDRRHAIVHLALLAVACAFLPLGISRAWRPSESARPIANVLGILARSIGVPLCVLAATSPLIQRWHVALSPNRGDRVYRLYAIGNVASLLVLLAYPLAIEPTMTLRAQLAAWSIGFAVLAVLLGVLAFKVGRAFPPDSDGRSSAGVGSAEAGQGGLSHDAKTIVAWIALSAIPSSLLLGVTTFLTSDVAAVPFLWVLPLTLYLGAFSLAFAGLAPWPFVRHAVGPGLAMTGLLIVGALDAGIPAYAVVALRAGTFFVLTWACLAALYERRPGGAGLTAFYLWIAVGGVIGGAFNSLVAPAVFHTTAEYPIATFLAAAVAFVVPRRPRHEGDRLVDVNAIIGRSTLMIAMLGATVYGLSEARVALALSTPQLAALIVVPVALCACPRIFPIASCVGSGLVAGSVVLLSFGGLSPSESHRSFFGVHKIITPRADYPTDPPFVTLMHGTTVHGMQDYSVVRRRPVDPDLPLAYYHRAGPLGAIMAAVQPTRVGVVGLGAGTIAAYVGAGQSLTYFEIDPLVIHIADGRPFTFLPAARARGATIEIVEGDARLTLNRDGPRFDLLVLDAFSGDAIPAHLLTRESFAIYARRLAPGGTMAIHISNRYLDLSRVVAADAPTIGGAGVIGDESTWQVAVAPVEGSQGSTWAVITRSGDVASKLVAPRWRPLPATTAKDAWTDDFSNLLHTLR